MAPATLTRFSKNESPPFATPSEDIVTRFDEKVIHSSVFRASAPLRLPLNLGAVREGFVGEEHRITGKKNSDPFGRLLLGLTDSRRATNWLRRSGLALHP